jgi:hypothetical protein
MSTPIDRCPVESENPNDEHNQAHAGAMEAVLLDAIETLTYLTSRNRDRATRDRLLVDMQQRFLTVIDTIGDQRDGVDGGASREGKQ